MFKRILPLHFQKLSSRQTHRFFTTSTLATSSFARFLRLIWATCLSVCCLGIGYFYITDTRSSFHRWLVVPALRRIYPDAEDAHHAGTSFLKALYSFNLHPRERSFSDLSKGNSHLSDCNKLTDIGVTIFGQRLDNPIGTSAGIDKLAEIPDALFALGPAIVEVGGVTPRPQEGNPRPRVFRLPNHQALINRYGLNGKGADDMARKLRDRVQRFAYQHGYGAGAEGEAFVLDGHAGVPPGSLANGKLLAVQVAKNKNTKDDDIEAVRRDYVYCVEKLAPYADILVVNVSSPNTPGLRTLQKMEPLTHILKGVVEAANSVHRKSSPPRVMVKVSPDEDSEEQVSGIVEAIWRSNVDGVIVGNTTNSRKEILESNQVSLSEEERKTLSETGGLSCPMMFQRTVELVKRYHALLRLGPPTSESKLSETKNSQPQSSSRSNAKVIFASGGITNGQKALEVLQAGASVAQIYTAMVYGGSGTVTRIKEEMREALERKEEI